MCKTEAVSDNKEETAYYVMNMPEWLLDLPHEKKIQIAKDFAKDSPNDEILTQEDILSLLPSS